MKNIMFCIGLPRSGSTLLMSILNENPELYCTGTCPLPYLMNPIKSAASQYSEFIAMDMDVLNTSLSSYIKHGINGWFESMTNKPNVISKSRPWAGHLNYLFQIYDNPKFIYCVRDIRDIVVSLDKLYSKYARFGNDAMSLDQRIKAYCTEEHANLGRPLSELNHILDFVKRYPDNFYLYKWETFCEHPKEVLEDIYRWMDLPFFEHDLNNIKPLDYIEHDHAYRSVVSHKVESKLRPNVGNWKSYLTEKQSKEIVTNLRDFYCVFYPEVLDNV